MGCLMLVFDMEMGWHQMWDLQMVLIVGILVVYKM